MTDDRHDCLEDPVADVLDGKLVVARPVREGHRIEVGAHTRVRRAAQVQTGAQVLAVHACGRPSRRMGSPIEPDAVTGQDNGRRRLGDAAADVLDRILVVARHIGEGHRIEVRARIRVRRAA